MLSHLVMSVALAALLGSACLPASAGDPPKPLYVRMIEQYPAPALKVLSGREYKCLIDPASLPKDPKEAFDELWRRLEAASDKGGFKVTRSRKAKKPLKVEATIKEYLDTPGQELWRQGYLLRVTTKAKKGAGNRTITVKAIHDDVRRTLATPLTVVGVDARTEAEGNVGIGRNGQLSEYVEKGTSWSVSAEQLGSLTLGDFGKFMPELLKLGLPPTTQLVSTKVYAFSTKAGELAFPGTGAAPVALEAWSRTPGGEIFLFDLAYRFKGDYYANSASEKAAEQFMTGVLYGDLKTLTLPGSGRWGGSKVRALMNRPVAE
jgi:hypothetical protein